MGGNLRVILRPLLRYRQGLVYSVLGLAWLGLGRWGSAVIQDQPLWVALALTLLFGTPLLCAGLYGATIRRIRRLHLFAHSGLLHRLATGRLLVSVFWLLWSVASAYLLMFYLGSASSGDWLLLLAALPVFALMSEGLARIARRELKPYIALQASLASARLLFAISMALLQLIIVSGADLAVSSLPEAMEQAAAAVSPPDSNSLLIQETAQWMVYYEGLKLYTLGHLSAATGSGHLLLVFTGSVALFFNVALALSAFAISPAEYRRVVTPVADLDEPSPIYGRTLAGTLAITSFVSLFVYVPLAAYAELWLSQHTQAVADLHRTQQRLVVSVEQIEDRYYRPGTVEKIRLKRIDTLAELEPGLQGILSASNRGYELMAGNVDSYLDWYYSLPAEYGRIVALVTGNIEEMMTRELQEHLTRGNAFGDLQQSVTAALARQEELQLVYRQSVEDILRENTLETQASSTLHIAQKMSLDMVAAPPSHSSLSSLEGRLLASGATGAAITGVIAAKITAKVVGKGTIKLGAKALTKVAASKASGALGGSAAGAAAGAALGSAFPGIGTVIGGTIGGIVGGIAVGVSVEALLLMLEEALSRDDFKGELLRSIEEARVDFNNRLTGAQMDDETTGNGLQEQEVSQPII